MTLSESPGNVYYTSLDYSADNESSYHPPVEQGPDFDPSVKILLSLRRRRLLSKCWHNDETK
jgi:hypothetical protein